MDNDDYQGVTSMISAVQEAAADAEPSLQELAMRVEVYAQYLYRLRAKATQ